MIGLWSCRLRRGVRILYCRLFLCPEERTFNSQVILSVYLKDFRNSYFFLIKISFVFYYYSLQKVHVYIFAYISISIYLYERVFWDKYIRTGGRRYLASWSERLVLSFPDHGQAERHRWGTYGDEVAHFLVVKKQRYKMGPRIKFTIPGSSDILSQPWWHLLQQGYTCPHSTASWRPNKGILMVPPSTK